MSEIKLLPCPFCGNDDRNEQRVSVRRIGNRGYKVVCGRCGGSGPYVAVKEWHDTKMIAQSQAIEAWNTRKPMQEIVKKLEEWKNSSQDSLEKCGFEKAIEIVKRGGVDERD